MELVPTGSTRNDTLFPDTTLFRSEDPDDGEVDISIYADNGPVTVDKAGEIRGRGTISGSAESRPSGGIVIAQPGSSVTNRNSGEITGGSNGIATSYFFSEDANGDELPPQPLAANRSEEHTSELQSLMRSSYAVLCLQKKRKQKQHCHHSLKTAPS